MKTLCLKSLVALGVLASVAVQANAQPLFRHVDSIESTVANADLVFIAKIVELGVEIQADGNVMSAATLAVEQRLKPRLGEMHERFRVNFRKPGAVLADWRDRAHRLLVAAGGELSGTAEAIDLADENLQVFSADLTLLRDPEAIIRLAKETVNRIPAAIKRLHTFNLALPNEVIEGTEWVKWSGVFVSVPADERLEARALGYLDSDDYSRRHEGVLALQYFKADENIARLRRLLNDPGWGELRRAEENHGIEVRHYGVRYDAFRILKSWGIEAARPVFREEIEKLGSVTAEDFSNRAVTDAEIKALARFENLEALFFWNSPVTNDQLKSVGELKNLRDLCLDGTQVTDAGMKELKGLTHLRYLGLGGTKVSDAALTELVRFKSLRKLRLTGTRTTDKGIADLLRLRPDIDLED